MTMACPFSRWEFLPQAAAPSSPDRLPGSRNGRYLAAAISGSGNGKVTFYLPLQFLLLYQIKPLLALEMAGIHVINI